MPNYPGSAPSFTAKAPGQTITSAGINAIADEVVAIGTALVTGPLAHSLTINGQIVFPATQSASANVNTLDDYEEGTWTPVIGGAGGTSGQVYSSQNGTYVKVGKLVFFGAEVVMTTKGTITGDVQIQGLPFTVGSATGDRGVLSVFWNGTANNFVYITGFTNAGATTAAMYGIGAAAASLTALATANVQDGTGFVISGCYRASA